jgi:O-antigen/teichoic acid export membrane protein
MNTPVMDAEAEPHPSTASSGLLRNLFARLPPSLRATALYGLGIAWSRGVGLLMVPVMTGHLSPGEFGRLELLASAAEICGLMLGAGLVDTLFRFAAAPGAAGRRAAAEIVGLSLALGLLGFIIVALFGSRLAAAMPLMTPSIDLWLLGVQIVMDALIGVALGWLRMQGLAGHHALAAGLRATVQALLVAVMLHLGQGVTGVVGGSAVAATVTALVLLRRQAGDTGLALDPRVWGRLLIYSTPLVGSGLASFVLGSADRWLLADSVPPQALGHYALAVRFALITGMLMQPFDLWWYARRMAVLAQPDGAERTARVIRLGVAGIAVAAAGTAAFAPPLIAALSPASYAPAMEMLPWLVLALAVQMLSSLVNVGCYVGKTTGLPLAVNTAAAAVALALYVALIPRLGVDGAIIATVAAQLMRLAIFTILSQRRVRIALPYRLILLLTALATATGTAPQLLTGWTAILLSVTGLTATSVTAALAVRVGRR